MGQLSRMLNFVFIQYSHSFELERALSLRQTINGFMPLGGDRRLLHIQQLVYTDQTIALQIRFPCIMILIASTCFDRSSTVFGPVPRQ